MNFLTGFLLLDSFIKLLFFNIVLTVSWLVGVCGVFVLIFGEEFFQLLEFYTKSCGSTGIINIIIIMVVIQDYG